MPRASGGVPVDIKCSAAWVLGLGLAEGGGLHVFMFVTSQRRQHQSVGPDSAIMHTTKAHSR